MKVGPIYEYPAMLRFVRGRELVLAAEERASVYRAERDAYAAKREMQAARIADLERRLAGKKRGGR